MCVLNSVGFYTPRTQNIIKKMIYFIKNLLLFIAARGIKPHAIERKWLIIFNY